MPLDTSETQKLIDAVNDFPAQARKEAEAILAKGAVNIKRNLKDDARGSKHFKQFAKKITFDRKSRKHGAEIEIGPENDKTIGKGGGPGAAIAYFGGANGGGGSLDFDEPVEREFDTIDEHMKNIGDLL